MGVIPRLAKANLLGYDYTTIVPVSLPAQSKAIFLEKSVPICPIFESDWLPWLEWNVDRIGLLF